MDIPKEIFKVSLFYKINSSAPEQYLVNVPISGMSQVLSKNAQIYDNWKNMDPKLVLKNNETMEVWQWVKQYGALLKTESDAEMLESVKGIFNN